jgi:hypothetical protein
VWRRTDPVNARHGLCTPITNFSSGFAVPVQFKTSGCLFSIVASVVLTVVLNLMLRACAG